VTPDAGVGAGATALVEGRRRRPTPRRAAV